MHSRQRSLPLILQNKTNNISRKNKIFSLGNSPVSLQRKNTELQQLRSIFIQTKKRARRGSIEAYNGPIGTKAKLEYYHTLKNLQQIDQRNKIQGLTQTPNVAFLRNSIKNRGGIQPLGVVRRAGEPSDFNLRSMSIGNDYAISLSHSLKHFEAVKSVNLRSNRLSEIGAYNILKRLPLNTIQVINLSNNAIGGKSVKKLLKILDNYTIQLKELQLENTGLTQDNVLSLMDSIENHSYLEKLNLARNKLQGKSIGAIGKMIQANSNIKTLDLHWNMIRGHHAIDFFEGLKTNNEISYLDLSWNSMGNQSQDVIQAFSDALKYNQTLIHLDFSYNNLSFSECELLSKGLDNNNIILGLHVYGNNCMVDSRGFLIPQQTQDLSQNIHLHSRIIESQQTQRSKNVRNCWICENWQEVEIEIQENQHGITFIHLDCDAYEPELLHNEQGSNTITRVVPQSPVKYYFSTLTEAFVSSNYPQKELHQNMTHQVKHHPNSFIEFAINCINENKFQGKPIINQPHTVVPRTPANKYFPPDAGLIRIDWSIPISLFKDYVFDSPKLQNNCFEFDWKHAKIEKFIKDEETLAQLKEFLRQKYRYIKETYKVLSALSGGEVTSITSNFILDFISQCGINDSYYSSSDVGVNWNATVLPKIKGQKYNPTNALVRYEFMEILVRISFDKFIRSSRCDNPLIAFQQLYQENLQQVMEKNDSNIWRMEQYVNEDIDLTLKAHLPILEQVFERFSGRKTLPGYKKFMSLDELRELCLSSGLNNDNFATRDIDVCYSLAMMTQVDELYKKRHMEMSFVEFIEAFARAADQADLPFSDGKKGNNLQDRIMNAFKYLIILCKPGLKETFVFPKLETIEAMKYRKP